MPPRRKTKRPYRPRKRTAVKKKGKYRQRVARMARPLNVKPRSAGQNVTYYNSFQCKPTCNPSGTVGSKQQNFMIKMNLNSLWPFDSGFGDLAGSNGQILLPNEAITGYATPVTDEMTSMPNVRGAGANLFEQYSSCCVVGTKVTLVATPIKNTEDTQLGYLYAIKHSQPNSGLALTSTVSDINKMPYRSMAKIQGPATFQVSGNTNPNTSAKLVITHSPKRFNNVRDLKDNKQLFNSTGSNSSAHKPTETDYLSIGVTPSLNSLDTQVTDFCLQIRVEQRLLWTEPLESLNGAEGGGAGNFSFPWNAMGSAAAITAGGMYF